jgi:hypothetical protein
MPRFFQHGGQFSSEAFRSDMVPTSTGWPFSWHFLHLLDDRILYLPCVVLVYGVLDDP